MIAQQGTLVDRDVDAVGLVIQGLCATCLHADSVRSSKGSVFVLCRVSYTDPRFPRYPTLPVITCAGYTPSGGKTQAAQAGVIS